MIDEYIRLAIDIYVTGENPLAKGCAVSGSTEAMAQL